MALSKIPLSGSTNGRGILVSATVVGSAVTVHQAQTGTTNSDFVYLEAINTDTQNRTVTICWGGITNPDDYVTLTLSPGVTTRISTRRLIQNALYIKAFGEVANKIIVWGDVLRES